MSAKILTKDEIVSKVATEVLWWLGERRDKLIDAEHGSMAINPFLLPLVMGLHGYDVDELASFMLGAHLSTGHATGFGKLVDEKILPRVFGTTKLTARLRAKDKILARSEFDEIDHLVIGPDGRTQLLSLKSGRWTIQLTMAVQLNASFKKLVETRSAGKFQFEKIVVGVFYGTDEGLTDKFRILRGINTGKKHDVYDLTQDVFVLTGRKFWSWLNGGQRATQEWVMEGVLRGHDLAAKKYGSFEGLTDAYTEAFVKTLQQHVRGGKIDWFGLLADING